MACKRALSASSVAPSQMSLGLPSAGGSPIPSFCLLPKGNCVRGQGLENFVLCRPGFRFPGEGQAGPGSWSLRAVEDGGAAWPPPLTPEPQCRCCLGTDRAWGLPGAELAVSILGRSPGSASSLKA